MVWTHYGNASAVYVFDVAFCNKARMSGLLLCRLHVLNQPENICNQVAQCCSPMKLLFYTRLHALIACFTMLKHLSMEIQVYSLQRSWTRISVSCILEGTNLFSLEG